MTNDIANYYGPGQGLDATGIDGVFREREGDHYAVTFTLFLDAENPEQASERAMAFRCHAANGVHDLPYDWHLHDHQGC